MFLHLTDQQGETALTNCTLSADSPTWRHLPPNGKGLPDVTVYSFGEWRPILHIVRKVVRCLPTVLLNGLTSTDRVGDKSRLFDLNNR